MDSENLVGVQRTPFPHPFPPSPGGEPPPLRTYATISCGFETMITAWRALQQSFRVTEYPHDWEDGVPSYQHPRYSSQLLNRHSTDVLVVGNDDTGHAKKQRSFLPVRGLLDRTRPDCYPKVVVEVWPDRAPLWEDGPTTKFVRTWWSEKRYETRMKRVAAVTEGAAIEQDRLVIVRLLRTGVGDCSTWEWLPTGPEGRGRPMSNLLIPDGLVPRVAWWHHPPPETKIHQPTEGPMPKQWKACIQTPRGYRRLMPTEYAKALGVPEECPLDRDNGRLYRTTTALHIWEYVGRCMWNFVNQAPNEEYGLASNGQGDDSPPNAAPDPEEAHSPPELPTYEYCPPPSGRGEPLLPGPGDRTPGGGQDVPRPRGYRPGGTGAAENTPPELRSGRCSATVYSVVGIPP